MSTLHVTLSEDDIKRLNTNESASRAVRDIIHDFNPTPDEILAQIKTDRVTATLGVDEIIKVANIAKTIGKPQPAVARAWVELYSKHHAANEPWHGVDRRM